MATPSSTAQSIDNRTRQGLAAMRRRWKNSDGEIEYLSGELWNSWPVRAALSDLDEDDPHVTLAVLAGRMFLAGRESTLPSAASQAALVSESTGATSAAVDAFAKAICAVSRREEGASSSLADHFEQMARAAQMPPQALSILRQLAISVCETVRDQIATELGQDDRQKEEIPQSEIDREVEKILRRSQAEGGAA